MKKTFTIQGKLVDIYQKKIYAAEILVENERIISITNLEEENKVQDSGNKFDHYIIPGFIDAHVHIESSMLIPS